jgi:uncharacterized protein
VKCEGWGGELVAEVVVGWVEAIAETHQFHLGLPILRELMEVQDNNGEVNDGVVDANVTFNRLISAIQAAGGPGYQFRSINPVDDQDGGEPGGNIRVGFLFNPARVTFVDRPGGSSTSTTTVVGGAQGPALSVSPGRLDPLNPAFTRSRKPLVGEFLFDGHTLFIIANHFNSKGGDQPLYRPVPPGLASIPRYHSGLARLGWLRTMNVTRVSRSIVLILL